MHEEYKTLEKVYQTLNEIIRNLNRTDSLSGVSRTELSDRVRDKLSLIILENPKKTINEKYIRTAVRTSLYDLRKRNKKREEHHKRIGCDKYRREKKTGLDKLLVEEEVEKLFDIADKIDRSSNPKEEIRGLTRKFLEIIYEEGEYNPYQIARRIYEESKGKRESTPREEVLRIESIRKMIYRRLKKIVELFNSGY